VRNPTLPRLARTKHEDYQKQSKDGWIDEVCDLMIGVINQLRTCAYSHDCSVLDSDED